jgi:hypothetical protein
MNCPYCDFKFKTLIINMADIPRNVVAPVLCEDCARVSLLIDGGLRKLQDGELETIKGTQAWKDFLEPVQRLLQRRKLARNARNN